MLILVLVVLQDPWASVLHEVASAVVRAALMNPDWGHINGIADALALMV